MSLPKGESEHEADNKVSSDSLMWIIGLSIYMLLLIRLLIIRCTKQYRKELRFCCGDQGDS